MRFLSTILLMMVFAGVVARADEVSVAMHKLRANCKACHAVGRLRFIYTPDDQQMLQDIFTKKSPRSDRLWRDLIVEVLDWPSEQAPSFEQYMKPPDRDWMPKGARRLDLAEDWVGNESARRLILRVLEN